MDLDTGKECVGVTAGSRLVRHKWGVLGTTSAAFSYCERETKLHGLQFKAKGQEY